MQTKLIFPLLIAVFLGILVFEAGAREQSRESFKVKVESPARDGITAGKSLVVSGTADLPPDYHLWVLARRIDFGTDGEGLWWPQNVGRINPRTGKWNVEAVLGQAHDVGWDFEIAVVVFDLDAHNELMRYRSAAVRSGDFRPYKIPVPATTPKIFQVEKINNE